MGNNGEILERAVQYILTTTVPVKLLLETAVEEGLQQLVDFPTHTKGNTLDLLLTNCPDKVIEVSDSGRLGRSDHCMLKVV